MGWPRQSCAVLSRWLTTPPPPPPCPSFGLAILLFLRPFLSFSRVFREIPERPIISHNIIEARRARINRIRFPISRKKRYKRIFCRGRYSCSDTCRGRNKIYRSTDGHSSYHRASKSTSWQLDFVLKESTVGFKNCVLVINRWWIFGRTYL